MLYGAITGLKSSEKGRLTNPGTGNRRLAGKEDTLGSVQLRLAPDHQPWEMNFNYLAACLQTSQGLAIPLDNVNNNTAKVFGNAPDPYIRRCLQSQSLSGKYTTDNWLFTAVSSWQQIKITRYFATPFAPMISSQNERWLQDIQEIRASTLGKHNLIDGVAGLYRQNIRQSKVIGSFDNQWQAMPGKTNGNTQMQSLAAYTDLSWHITPQWDLGGGLRLSHDSASTLVTMDSDNMLRRGTVSRNHILGQLSAGYQFTEQNRLYARIAQGYKPTGFDYHPNGRVLQPAAYKPENSLSYEIGHLYDSQPVTIKSALFYTRTRDLQMYTTRPDDITLSELKNLGDTTVYGAELAADYRFIAGWLIGGNINLTHARFTDAAKNGSYANKPVPFVADYSGAIYLSGSINTAAGTFSPWLGVNIHGSYHFDETPFRQRAYSSTDLRLAWQPTERITLSAYVNNLFDKRYFTYAASLYNFGYSSTGRTAGVDLKIELF